MKLVARPVVVAAFWLGAALAGAWWLHDYEAAAGDSGKTPNQWPARSRIQPSSARPVLMLFAHPKCPCTRASIEELNRLMARANGLLEAHALFLQPEHAAKDWCHTSLWNSAAAIPGVVVETDPDGIEARRFGAETSGFVVLYSPKGELLFHGGITAGRGHAGDNVGCEAIVALASGASGASGLRNQTPVFGCGLFDGCER